MAKDCLERLQLKDPQLHKFLRDKAGIDYDGTNEVKEKYRQAAKELQNETLNDLHNVYNQAGLPNYKEPIKAAAAEAQKESIPSVQKNGEFVKNVNGLDIHEINNGAAYELYKPDGGVYSRTSSLADAEKIAQDYKAESIPSVSGELKVGGKIQWNVFGNEDSGEWTVGERTKTRGGQDAVVLSKQYIESSEDGKDYTKEYADANGIKYNNDPHTVEHIVPISDLQPAEKSLPKEQKADEKINQQGNETPIQNKVAVINKNEVVPLKEGDPKLRTLEHDLKNGDIVTATINGNKEVGTVTGVGEHKGQIVIDFRDSKGRDRFVYAHQIENVERGKPQIDNLTSEQKNRISELINKDELSAKELNELKLLTDIREGKSQKQLNEKTPIKEVDKSNQQIKQQAKEGIEQPPKPPEETKGAAEGQGEEVGGITQAANSVRRQDTGLPEFQRDPQSFEQWNNEAEKLLKEGYDVEKLMKRLEAGEVATPVENAIRKIYYATVDAEVAKNPTDALLLLQKRNAIIGDAVNRRAGQNLVSLKGEGSPLSSISDFYVAKMEAAGVDKLTDQQKKETKEAFDNVQKADENATAAMEAYREEIAKLKAENELLKEKKATPKKSHGDRVQQRQDAIDGARAALKKLRTGESGLSAVPLPGLRELIAIAPHVKKYVGSLLGEGADNLKAVVSKTYEAFKDVLEGITEKDIHNMLAGDYNEAKPTRNELAARMRDIQDEAYYINKLERLLKGEEPKKEREKVTRNQQITGLQKKIKDLQKELPPTDAELKKRLESIKTKNETEAAKIKERIAKGDFATKKPIPFLEDTDMQRKFPKQYKAALDAIVKRQDARHEFDIALLKDQMAKRNFAKKYVVDLAGDILGTTRALTTGIDASGIGIQNIVAMVAHPRSAAKALPASFGDFISAERQERWLASVHSSSLFPLAQKFGLDITQPQSLKASEREEIFTHNLLDRRIRYNYKGKEKTFVISKYTTKPFERIFTGLGNRMRWNLWQRGVEQLYEEGYTPEQHPKEFESLAKVLNTETGRGTLHPEIDKAYNLVSSIIWSPRLMASRMNILGLGDLGNLIAGGKKGYYGGLTPRMREYAFKDLAKFVIFGSTLMALAGVSFADDTDIDPNSATFGTFEANGKRYNVWGGFTQYVRLVAALSMGGEKKGGTFKESNQLKTSLRFLWGKTTPAVGTGIALLNKDSKDYMGIPITTGAAIQNLVVPLSIRGIIHGIKKEGAGSILWTGVPSFIGMNVSYESDFNKRNR